MRKLLAYFISIYQRKLSPYKGFSCAHRCLHGSDSCSEFTKKQILDKGVFSSVKTIKQRFGECRDAALLIRQGSAKAQRGDCDPGCGSCAFDIGGCGSASPSADCPSFCIDGCFDIGRYSKRNTMQFLLTLTLIALLLFGLSYYFIGRQISTINIRLKEGVEETADGTLAKLFQAQRPDYKVNFSLKEGSSNTYILKNTSAKKWISLKPRDSFYLSDIINMTVVNKGLTHSEELESFSAPSKNGEGELFEYTIKQRWEFF